MRTSEVKFPTSVISVSVYKGSEVISEIVHVWKLKILWEIMKPFAGKETIILNLCRIFNIYGNRQH
jgi:hypothetical protein